MKNKKEETPLTTIIILTALAAISSITLWFLLKGYTGSLTSLKPSVGTNKESAFILLIHLLKK